MYKRILVPVDGSDLADRAIPASLELARQLGATVIGYVAEPMPPIPSSPRTEALLREELKAHAAATHAHASGVLAASRAPRATPGCPSRAGTTKRRACTRPSSAPPSSAGAT
jgi:nucleotide-binding universal stress UspA family protein